MQSTGVNKVIPNCYHKEEGGVGTTLKPHEGGVLLFEASEHQPLQYDLPGPELPVLKGL